MTQIQEVIKVSVVIVLALTGMVVMLGASEDVYKDEIGDDIIQNFTELRSNPQSVTKKVAAMQGKLTKGSQFTGIDLIDKGVTLLFVGWDAIILMLDTLIELLTFASDILIMGSLQTFGIGWAAVPIMAFVGAIVIFALLNIAFRGRFT